MLSTYYTVTITASGLGGAAPADGFIDNTKIEQYMAAGGPPSTVDLSKAKERANVRFNFVQQQIELMCNGYLSNMVATGANANTPATAFSFTVEVERGDSVLYTIDETSPPTALTGAAALKRCVARALLASSTRNTEFFDPTVANVAVNATNLAVRGGVRVEQLTTAAIASNLTTAESKVTVTKLSV